MIGLALLSFGGLIAGVLLLRRVPLVPRRAEPADHAALVSVIVPARNEEANIGLFLASLSHSAIHPIETLVVDDCSTDATAAVARKYGATVLTSTALPTGWTGKTWACHQGAAAARGDVLFFLDADTRFVSEGYERIIQHFETLPKNAVLSLLPFHRTACWYEELSLFFNILVAMGAGGFGGLDHPHLFGQSLVIHNDLYKKAKGHVLVRREILENLHFAAQVRSVGGTTKTLGGLGTLEMRMFPGGLGQLRESWQKAFTAGAGVISRGVLGLSIFWLGGAMLAALLLCAPQSKIWPVACALYMLNVIEIAWFGRQLGTSRWMTSLMYPIALVFYFATFGQSLWRQKRGVPVTWRGRSL